MAGAERALIAARDGDLQTLRTLRRTVPYAADGFGASTLHYAARNGKLECIQWLVESVGISPKVKGRSGAIPLHDAAAQGQLDCVKYFIEHSRVDADTRDSSGHTALHLAARFGRFETVKWLLEKGNGNPRAKSRNHMTPVHFAASGGHLTCLQLLIFKSGYSCVNDVATDGTTPLYLSTQDGNLDCLKYLHSVGGKCDMRARDGMLPIHGAAQNGHLDCVGYLIESGEAAVTERDTTGATPAHYAASQGHVSVLKWLNAKGDISLVDNVEGTPLHDAAEQGQYECLKYLVETVQLDVNQIDKEGFSALALAEKNRHRKCVDYLKIAASKKITPTLRSEGDEFILEFQAKAHKRQGEAKQSFIIKDNDSAKLVASKQQYKTIVNLESQKEKAKKSVTAISKKDPVKSQKQVLPKKTTPRLVSHVISAKPLRERQLQPLPHFGSILPPPPEFSENSGNNHTDNEESSLALESVTADVYHHASGSLQITNVSNNAEDCLTGAGNGSTEGGAWCDIKVNDQQKQGEDGHVAVRDTAEEVEVAADTRPFSNKSDLQVPSWIVLNQLDQPGSENEWNALTTWKRQVLVSRMIKEKARQRIVEDMREIEKRKWVGVPKWKIPLLTKREEARLKEEQRWFGIPEWKKDLIKRRESISSRN